jgi:hypothetical protein
MDNTHIVRAIFIVVCGIFGWLLGFTSSLVSHGCNSRCELGALKCPLTWVACLLVSMAWMMVAAMLTGWRL